VKRFKLKPGPDLGVPLGRCLEMTSAGEAIFVETPNCEIRVSNNMRKYQNMAERQMDVQDPWSNSRVKHGAAEEDHAREQAHPMQQAERRADNRSLQCGVKARGGTRWAPQRTRKR
jgi:hypothetical protein